LVKSGAQTCETGTKTPEVTKSECIYNPTRHPGSLEDILKTVCAGFKVKSNGAIYLTSNPLFLIVMLYI